MALRPARDNIYMEIAHVLRKRSTCLRGQVGAVLVMDQRIIATGYNGSPPGAPHCADVGCEVPDPGAGCQRTIHAEANVIAFAARHGARVEGSSLYCTAGPCLKCAQLIASSGIREVIFETPYRVPDGLELLDSLNIPAREFHTLEDDVGVWAFQFHGMTVERLEEMFRFAEAKGWGSDEEGWVEVDCEVVDD